VAAALSWAVSHAEGRVTQIRRAFTGAIYEFATHVREVPLCPALATLEERAGYRELFRRFGLAKEIEQADVDAAVMLLSGGNVVDIV
jgi:hypothetical protein